jgi:hypothetical protein
MRFMRLAKARDDSKAAGEELRGRAAKGGTR